MKRRNACDCRQRQDTIDWANVARISQCSRMRKRTSRRSPGLSTTIRRPILSFLSFITLVLLNPSGIDARQSKSCPLAFQNLQPLSHPLRVVPDTQRDEPALSSRILNPPKRKSISLSAHNSIPSKDASAGNNPQSNIPRHVAFICDGNSRWAKARGLPSSAGHAAGADQLVKTIDALKESGVSYCSLFAFSTENWKRPAKEINDLLKIMEESCHRFYNRVMSENVRVQILGDLEDERIPDGLRKALYKLERDTAEHCQQQSSPFTVCFAINYGGKKDILNASLKLAQAMVEQQLSPAEVDEELFDSFLSTRDIPDPDLIIRTSGECRLSNFMLWNAAYAELYFTNVLWPDFDKQAWQEALQWYSQRQRKFGGRQQQLEGPTTMRNGARRRERKQ